MEHGARLSTSRNGHRLYIYVSAYCSQPLC